MRLYSFSGGIVVLAVVGLFAGGFTLALSTTVHADTASHTTVDNVPTFVARLMNWAHAGSLLDYAELPADPSTQYVVVDLRSAQDFARGHLAGAVNVPPEFLVAHLGEHVTDPNRAILLYGYSEMQSLQSVMALRLFAYQKVLHLRSGWPATASSAHEELAAP